MSINRPRSSNSVRKRIFRKAIIALLALGIPMLLFLFQFGIQKAEVIGESRYTDQQIRDMVLESRLDYNSIYLYLKYRFFTTPDIPFIEKLDIEMNSRHEVTIYVYEKIVTGCVYVMGEYMYFDKDGIIVESSSEKVEKVPVIEGLQFRDIVLHDKLKLLDEEQTKEEDSGQENTGGDTQSGEENSGSSDEQETEKDEEESTGAKDKLFDIILNLTKLINKYELDVDVVRFDENNNVTLKCGDIRVLLGKKNDYEVALSDLKNILAKAEGTKAYELDMRDYSKESNYVIGKSKDSTE